DTAGFLVDVIRPDGSGLRDVDSVSWSPMGSKVAYATEKGLFVSRSDWSNPRLVTAAEGSDGLDWTVDDGRFVFGSGRSSSCCWASLQLAGADGSGVRGLWTPPSDGPQASWINGAAWSPSGRQIAVDATINNAVASRNGGNFLYLVDPGGNGA